MNIIKYVKQFGHLSYNEKPFNEVDSLVLSELCYLNFSGIVGKLNENKPPMDFKRIVDKDVVKMMCKDTLFPSKNRKLWYVCQSSVRFGQLKIAYYATYYNANTETQFAATTFIFPNDTFYVAFRGTDITLIGWKEDFNMVLYENVPAQLSALSYLKHVIDRLPGRFYVGGHSKGGNLAEYASMMLEKKEQERMIWSFSHDGPGFKSLDDYLEHISLIYNKSTKTIPQDSIVGVTLHHRADAKIIEARSILIGQHNPFNWKINKKDGDFIYLKERSIRSKKLQLAVAQWINSINPEDRHFIVDTIFYLLDASKYTVMDYYHRPIKFFFKVRFRYRRLKKEDRFKFKKSFVSLRHFWAKNFIFFNRIYHPKKTKIPAKELMTNETIEINILD